YPEALDYQRQALQRTEPAHPNYPGLASNLGSLIAEAIQADALDTSAYPEAVEYQRQALQLTDPAHPNYPMYASNLGGRIAQAIQAGALDAESAAAGCELLVDSVWQALRLGASTHQQRREMLIKFRPLMLQVPWLVRAVAEPGAAIRAVEGLRDHLAAGMLAPELPATLDIPNDLAAAYRSAATKYNDVQRLAREPSADEPFVGDPRAAEVRDELRRAIEPIRDLPGGEDFGSRPSLATLAGTLDNQTLAVYLLAGPDGGAALLLDHQGGIRDVPLDGLSIDAVVEQADRMLTDRWSEDEVADRRRYTAEVESVAAWLWQVLAPLVDALRVDQRRWLIIPTGYLALLPWHAAGDPTTGQYLDDLFCTQIAPTLLHLDLAALKPAQSAPLVAVTAHDLPLVAGDRAVASHYLASAETAEMVDRDGLLRRLAETPLVVVSGHGDASLDEGGGLYFRPRVKGADEQMLTAELADRLPLRSRDLAILACCLAARPGTELADEFLGLPHSLLGAGFRGGAAAGGPVWDLTAFTALACLRQARHDDPDALPAQQLRAVRRWMRTTTMAQLQTWFDQLSRQIELPPMVRNWFAQAPRNADHTYRPLANAIDWAAFYYTGW
ncbi:MAG: CHAT domain-containing protein, partial [Frankiaceae bacterium]|nr:CHAT domain-containing protein [Frankiaceae bacterium]